MHLSKSDIFWKSWWWSIVCGAIVGIFFYTVTNINGLFHWPYGGATFIDLLILLSIAGSYLGAGYIGERIATKYYGDHERRYLYYYLRYSVVSFLALVAITYSPLSFLGLLWSFVAPTTVLLALGKVRPEHIEHPRKTMRTRRNINTR